MTTSPPDAPVHSLSTDPAVVDAIETALSRADRMQIEGRRDTNARKQLESCFRDRDAGIDIRYVLVKDAAPLDVRLDVDAVIREIAETCEEHGHVLATGCRVFTWFWVRASSRRGRTVLGRAGAYSAKQQALWPVQPAPFWQMGIYLPYWMLATAQQRFRLVHHELGHCGAEVTESGQAVPVTAYHDVEDFVATMGRFGVLGRQDADLVAAAHGHPEWSHDLEGELFPPWQENAE